MGLNRTVAPATYPVTLAEARTQCRVTSISHDSDLNLLIAAATDYVEKYLGRAIVSQTWELTLDDFSDVMLLPIGPVTSVASIKYDDTSGMEQTLSTDVYTVDTSSDPQWVVRNSDQSWPSVNDAINAVRIEFVAGYSTVPPSIKHAILFLISTWFDDRSAMREGVPEPIAALLVNDRSYA